MTRSRWLRTERLDAQRLVDAIRVSAGIALQIEGPCPGGQVGAAYVIWPDGHRAVLTWRPAIRLADLRAGPLAVIGVLRSAGYPAPAAELAVQVGGAVALVWELLPGAQIRHLTVDLLDQALALNDLQAGRLAGRDSVPRIGLHLTSDVPGYCLHGPLREHSARTRELDRWITTVGARHPGVLPGDDAVHQDFQPGNLLAEAGRITGVVDCAGLGRGDRLFDLVTLRFGVHAVTADPAAVRRLDRLLDSLPASVLDPMWAHMSLRMTDWAIRHFTSDDVSRWLDLAEQRAGCAM